VRLAQYSAIEQALSKSCDHEISLISEDDPSACADGCQPKSADPADRHRARALAVYMGAYLVAVVLGWCLVGVALAVWLP
jgi:hypothetical protein